MAAMGLEVGETYCKPQQNLNLEQVWFLKRFKEIFDYPSLHGGRFK